MTRSRAAAGLLLAIAALAAGCGSSHATAAQLRAIRSARHADGTRLGIFPTKPETIRCSIPQGGTHLKGTPGIPGRCTTSVRPPDQRGRVKVVFDERGRYPTPGDIASIALGGRWLVTVGRSGSVLGYTVTGDPPQLEK